MTTEETRYQFVEVKTVRGAEQRSIAKKQAEGWELVDHQSGTVRTTLRFRRPKPPVPWKMFAGLGAAAVVLTAALGIGAFLEDDDSTHQVNAAETVEAQPAESSGPAPATDSATVAEPAEVLTVENNPDLAAVLQERGSCSPVMSDFAANYVGQTIQFDGYIGNVAVVSTFGSLYNILIGAWDFDESDVRGPDFQYREIAPVRELNLPGLVSPDDLRVPDRFRFTAVVDSYEPDTCLFLLDPVLTEPR